MTGVAVVTGATGGMGRVIVRELVQAGMQVVAVARDGARAAADLSGVSSRTGGWEVIEGDLSERAGVTAVAAGIAARHDAVQLLVNNAGAHFPAHRLSPDGVEMHVAVDYLASFGMTAGLEAPLRRGRGRVVNVASDTLRDTRRVKLLGPPRPATVDPAELVDLTLINPAVGFVPFEAYARAKLLTVIAGYSFARSFAGEVTVNAVHPGIVSTGIIDGLVPRPLRAVTGLIRRTLLTPEDGAAATLRLALDPSLAGVTGRYFVRDVDTPTSAFSSDAGMQRQLVETSARFFRGAV